MGFLKQMKDMKNTLHEAPGTIDNARQLGAQAQIRPGGGKHDERGPRAPLIAW